MTVGSDVVWITIESTRADHTSMAGYHRDTTPCLQRIADAPRGRSFDACFAHGIWTLASSASILTGTYPTHHDAGMESETIPEGLPTVPEAFQELGYRTACLSTNGHLSSATGLDRGFDRFGWLSRDTLLDVAGPGTLAKYLLNIRRHSAGLTAETKKHSTAYLVNDVLERWIREFADESEPSFLYAHFGDPHHLYYPPRPYQGRFLDDGTDPSEARAVARHHHENLHDLIAAGCPLTDREWTLLSAMYDATIRYTDHMVGELFEYVQTHLEDPIVVITADHGELFGEQGMLAHKLVVDDAVAHVPLVVHGLPDLLAHDGEMVQHADVMGTILATLGHEFPSGQGLDLRRTEREWSVIQRGEKRARKNLDRFRSRNDAFDDSRYHRGTLSALRNSTHKYLLSDEKRELFELPDEETDVSAVKPEVAASLDGTLRDWLESVGQPHSDTGREGAFTAAMQEQLADLGYLE